MPAINFTGTGKDAADLFNVSTILKGDAGHFKEREKLRDKIKEVWPELEAVKEDPEEEKARTEALKGTRSIELSTKVQTALAEGMLTFIKDKEQSDGAKIQILTLAKLCKFRGWLDKHSAGEVREFDGSDEAVEVDKPEETNE